MKKTMYLGRTTAIALPLIMAGSFATAGGLAEPVETVAPTPVVTPAPAPMMGSDWTGFYAGAQLGYGQLDPSLTGTDPAEPDGAVYGVHAGYMYDLGSIVLGAELDYDATNIEFDTPASELESVARAKLRVGYDAGAFLPYLTAGAARATTSGAPLDGDTDGTFAGLGLAYKVSDSIMVGGEVLQHQFDDVADAGITDVDATTATARVSFKF